METLKLWLEKNQKRVSIVSLAIIGFLVILIRMHYINEPLERNYTGWAYMGHQMLAGDKLYTDLYDTKPPGIFIIYMIGNLIWGYQPEMITYLGIIPTLISMMLIFMILHRIANIGIALLGSVFWMLAANAILIHANMPASEAFINTFGLLVAWGCVNYFHLENKSFLWIAGIGIACASFIKMHALFPFLLLCGYFAWHNYRSGNRNWIVKSVGECIVFSIPSVVLWGGAFLYFVAQHRFAEFYGTVFVDVNEYSGNVLKNIINFFTHRELLLPGFLIEIKILVFLTLGWILLSLGKFRLKIVKRSFWILVLFGWYVAVGSTAKYFAHYYQLILPTITICSAMFFDDLWELLRNQPTSAKLRVIGVLIAATIGYLTFYQVKALRMPLELVTQTKYGSLEFVHSRKLGKIIRGLTKKGDLVCGYFSDPGLYFYSGRKSASSIIYQFPEKLDTPMKKKKTEKYIGDVIANQPTFFIWATSYGDIKGSLLGDYISNNYQRVQQYMYFDIYKKNGG